MIFETIKPTDLRAPCSPFNLFCKKKVLLAGAYRCNSTVLERDSHLSKTHQKMDVQFLAGKKIRKYSILSFFGSVGLGIY